MSTTVYNFGWDVINDSYGNIISRYGFIDFIVTVYKILNSESLTTMGDDIITDHCFQMPLRKVS